MFELVPNGLRPENRFVEHYIRAHKHASRMDARMKYRKAMQCMFGMDPDSDNPRKRLRGAAAAPTEESFETSGHIPVLRPGQTRLIDLTDDECIHLPRWMNELVERIPVINPYGFLPQTGFAVFMEPQAVRYVMGICGTKDGVVEYILEHIGHEHPIFRHCFQRQLRLDMSSSLPTPDVRSFCENPDYKVALLTVSVDIPNPLGTDMGPSKRFYHARLLIKEGTGDDGILKLAITDPHGRFDTILGRDAQESIEERIRVNAGMVVNVRHAVQHSDQSYEGSCVAMSFMRMAFLLHKSNQTRRDELMSFIMEPIPCVFAVFVARLFTAANVILPGRYKHSVLNIRDQLGDFTLNEPPPVTTDRQEIKNYLVREAIAQGFHSRASPEHRLGEKVQNLLARVFPGEPRLSHSEFVWILDEIERRAPPNDDFKSVLARIAAEFDRNVQWNDESDDHMDPEVLAYLLEDDDES
jgi:hypothetical protein